MASELVHIAARMLDEAESSVSRGQDDEESIVELLVQLAEEEVDDVDEPTLTNLARAAVHSAIKDQIARQVSWPKVTDCDRLDSAFSDLNKRGVLTIAGDICCSNCAHDQLDGDVQNDLNAHGYAFYNAHDVAGVVPDASWFMFIGFGCPDGGPAEITSVAREVARALEKHGLKAIWDGDPMEKVWVRLTWQRRWKRTKRSHPVDRTALKVVEEAKSRPPVAQLRPGTSAPVSPAAAAKSKEVAEVAEAVGAEIANGASAAAAYTTVARQRGLRPFTARAMCERAGLRYAEALAPPAGSGPSGATGEAASLAGKTFVLTGKLDSMTRAEAADAIRTRGGRVAGSVTSDTDYLVVGGKPGSKQDRARAIGVKVLGEKAFARLLANSDT
jgi:hypothetical protein